jgi:hypothetical protein
VIYIATAHHLSSKWIRPQTDYLRRHLSEPYRVFASCEGIDQEWFEYFDEVVPSIGHHEGKLNLLAAEIDAIAAPDDLMMFLDGDAFPIADPMPLVRDKLEDHALVANRMSAAAAPPHPSFCVIPVHRWRELHGDWSKGHAWIGVGGDVVTDVGGNLGRSLERHGLRWHPLNRSNTVDLHRVWFGVFDSLVYHHGAAFRTPLTPGEHTQILGVSRDDYPNMSRLWRLATKPRRTRQRRRLLRHYEQTSDEVYEALTRDPDFWKRFVA